MSSEVEMRSSAQQRNGDHDEEQSSLLHNGSHSNGAVSSSPSRLAASPLSSPRSLSKDVAICTTAWSGLSTPTRSIFMLVLSALLVAVVYEFGVDEGVREQEADIFKEDEADLFGEYGKQEDDNFSSENIVGAGGEDHEGFSKEVLSNTRAKAEELINLLHKYYGGEEKAKSMLVNSWQAQWQLGEDYVFSDENEGGNDDDDVADDGNQKRRRTGDRTQRNKEKKEMEMRAKAGKLADNPDAIDNNDDINRKYDWKKDKKKQVKTGKVVDNPDGMSPEELKLHRHYRRQRTTKLVTTMARALLNPHQDKFIIGTIGSSVAAGHDNCEYDAYENQLQRTIAPVFAAAQMEAEVQNAGEGGGCGDSHQNQVFCITHNVSPDVDIIHYSWTYFEKEDAEVQREQLVRWAQYMERRPMVHHLVARGKQNTCNGDSLANAALDKKYAVYGYNAFCIQTGEYCCK